MSFFTKYSPITQTNGGRDHVYTSAQFPFLDINRDDILFGQ